jgi:ribose 5-phosphate isomerase B
MKTIGIGGDHAGFKYKTQLISFLQLQGYSVKDFGPSSDASVDYPDHVHPMATAVEAGELSAGILICGSGNVVYMTANKHKGIRAALCWSVDLAKLARQHNNANIICIPARFVSYNLAQEMAHAFLNTDFEGGRHQQRVDKISC